MFKKLHRQDGSEVWVNLGQVTFVTRARSGSGSEMHFMRSQPSGGWGAAAEPPAPPLIVREWAEDVIKAE